MVTTQEARQQLQQRQQEIASARKKIQQTRLAALTAAQKRSQTRADLISRKVQQQSLGIEKAKALKSLKPIEQELTTFEKELRKTEIQNLAIAKRNADIARKNRDLSDAIKIVDKKLSAVGMSPRIKRYVNQILERRAVAREKEFKETVLEIEAQGLTAVPIFGKGGIIAVEGFEKVKAKGIQQERIPSFSVKDLERIKKNQGSNKVILPKLPEGKGVSPIPTKKSNQVVEIINKKLKDVTKIGPGTVIKKLEGDIIKQKPKQIGLPDTGIKKVVTIGAGAITKFKFELDQRIKKLTDDVIEGTTISSKATAETRVDLINLPTPPQQTQISRPVGFQDIDTGALPPKQNFDMKVTRTIFEFNQGIITRRRALRNLESAQRVFVFQEAKRTAGVRFIEGAGIGALTVLAPPVGWTLIGLTTANAALRRQEILNFAARNPAAAAIQFGSGVVGGFVGAGGVSAAKIKPMAVIKQPTLKLKGKARTKLINTALRNMEFGERVEVGPHIRSTGTRTWAIDIPSPKNNVLLKIIEFSKNGEAHFIGLEFIKGKLVTKKIISGQTFIRGKGGDVRMITRVMKKHTKGGLSNVEIATYLEKAKTKSIKTKGVETIALTESELRLASQYKLRGLTPNQVREVLRRPLFGVKEAQVKAGKPFSQSEYNQAIRLGKSEVAISTKLVKSRQTQISEQVGPLIREREIIDLRYKENALGTVDLVVTLPKPRHTGIKPSDIKVQGQTKIPVSVRGGTEIKIIKGKTPRRTSLDKTFQALETAQILGKKISPNQKVAQLKELTKKISPVGAFKEIAKVIQKERLKLSIKQVRTKATKRTAIAGSVQSLKGLPLIVGGEGLTDAQLARFKGKAIFEEFEVLDIPATKLKGITKGQRSVSWNELDVNRPKVISDIDSILNKGKLSSFQLNKLKSLTEQANKLLKKTKTKQGNLIKSKIRLADKLAISGKLSVKQAQKLKQRLNSRKKIIQTTKTTLTSRVPRVPKVPKVPVILLPKEVKATDLVKALVKLKGKGVDVVTGINMGKRRVVARNLPPFKAMKFGKKFVDQNIQASYKLVPSGKKPKVKDIKPFNVGVKFRTAKKDPLFVVEKRKFRLDSPSERRQIKSARRKTNKKKKAKRK